MDKYTKIIEKKIKHFDKQLGVVFKKEYERRQKHVLKYIETNNSKEYFRLIRYFLDNCKGQSSGIYIFSLLIGLVFLFFFDYGTDWYSTLIYVLGLFNIAYAIYILVKNSKMNKSNAFLDNLISNLSEYVDFKTDSQDKDIFLSKNVNLSFKNSLEERLEEIQKLYKKGILTEEEYNRKRKQIIDNY